MKTKSLLLFIVSLIALSSFAQQSGSCGDNLKWTFNSETGMLTISGTGAMDDYLFIADDGNSYTPWYNYGYQIKYVEIKDGVTHIGNKAFINCTDIISVMISNSVVSIGDQAFSSCSSLTSLIIPSSVTSIGESAFSYCTGLISIDVDNANPLYSSEEGVLFNKEKTKLIFFPTGKSGSYTIPHYVVSIENDAFF